MRRGWRKFTVVLVVLGLAFVLALMERLGGGFVQIAITALASFSAANAYEHHVTGGRNDP